MSRQRTLMRDVLLHEEPHTLHRPRPPSAAAPSQPVPSTTSPATPQPIRPPQPPQPAAAPRSAPGPSLDSAGLEQARRQAFEEGLAKGREEALHQLRGQALREAREAAHKQGHEEGHEEGHEKGYQEGLRQAEQHAQSRLQEAVAAAERQAREAQARHVERFEQLEKLAAAMPDAVAQRLAQAEDDMLALAFEALCRILGEQAASAEGLRAHLGQALQSWRGRAALSVHLHPDDAALLQQDAELARSLAPPGLAAEGAAVRWVADPDVALGGCLLRSADGGLDARLELQLRKLQQALLQTRSARRQAAPLPAADPTVPEARSHGGG